MSKCHVCGSMMVGPENEDCYLRVERSPEACYKKGLDRLQQMIYTLGLEQTKTKRRADDLFNALATFGSHVGGCSVNSGKPGCNCGYSKSLKEGQYDG